MMTKLMPPKQQEALLQIPPSQKEMWVAESNPGFPVRPHANSNWSLVACELVDVQH
jgi:hypothetical protein